MGRFSSFTSASEGILLGGLGAVIMLMLCGMVLLVSGLKLLREYERVVIQTLAEVATENNSTTLFPVPIDLLFPFLYRS
jgi:hypothetical protein